MSDDNESVIKFPCQFPIKAMGYADNNLKIRLVEIASKHDALFTENQITETYSKNGKYISFTVTIAAINQAQLDAIYQELTACEHFVMVL